MRSQKFGVEVEFVGLSVAAAQVAIEAYLEGQFDHFGRRWLAVEDSSLMQQGFELVSPPLFLAEVGLLQDIFRELRHLGARRASTAGVHVHLAAQDLSVVQLRSLVNLYASYGDLIVRMLNVYAPRRLLFCQPVLPFARAVQEMDPATVDELKRCWYQVLGEDGEDLPTRYHESRYTELNLNSYFFRGTVEFRAFNSTNHAGRLRAMIELSLAMISFAKRYPGLVPLRTVNPLGESEALIAGSELLKFLGLSGRYFANTRSHLLKGIQRHYKRLASSGGASASFRCGKLSFEGDSFGEIIDEMWDNRFFDREDVDPVVRQLRKRAKQRESAAQQIFEARHDEELFARVLLEHLESVGIGRLIVG